MKKRSLLVAVLIATLLLFAGCKSESEKRAEEAERARAQASEDMLNAVKEGQKAAASAAQAVEAAAKQAGAEIDEALTEQPTETGEN